VTDYIVVADEVLERSLEAFNVQPAPSALDALRDAVVREAVVLCERVERDSMMIDLQFLLRAVAAYKAQEES